MTAESEEKVAADQLQLIRFGLGGGGIVTDD